MSGSHCLAYDQTVTWWSRALTLEHYMQIHTPEFCGNVTKAVYKKIKSESFFPTQMYTQVLVWQLCGKDYAKGKGEQLQPKGKQNGFSLFLILEKIITHLALPALMKLEGQKPESVERSTLQKWAGANSKIQNKVHQGQKHKAAIRA